MNKIVVYGHPFCPMVAPVISMLKQANVAYDYVNIYQDLEARQKVSEINNGYESVPTLIFPDGSILTEPSSRQLKFKLESIGYDVPTSAMLMANAPKLIFIMFILLWIFRMIEII